MLTAAYRRGIFPWPIEDLPTWWSPDPRAVLRLDRLHVSRSLRRTLRRAGLVCTSDVAFADVVDACARGRTEGTWVTDELAAAVGALHRAPRDGVAAHSIEVWDAAGALVGGLYGLAVGGVFSGESMFHRVSDASKVALVDLVRRLTAAGAALVDVQLPTDHLASLGAEELPRAAFLATLARWRDVTVRWPSGTWVPGEDDAGLRALTTRRREA